MSVKAVTFVRGLRGLSTGEKAVAYTMASHDDHKGAGCYAGVEAIAAEAGLAHRQNASDIITALAAKNVIWTNKRMAGGRPTRWFFNYGLIDRSPTASVDRSLWASVTAAVGMQSTAAQIPPNRSHEDVQPQPKTPPTAAVGLQEGSEGVNQKGKSSSRVDEKSDDDLKFYKAKTDLLASTLVKKDELSEAMGVIRERSSSNGNKPVLNWPVYLRKSLEAFVDADWFEVRSRIDRRKQLAARPKLTPEQIRAEEIARDNCQLCRGTGWKNVPRPDGRGVFAEKCDHSAVTEKNPALPHATQP